MDRDLPRGLGGDGIRGARMSAAPPVVPHCSNGWKLD